MNRVALSAEIVVKRRLWLFNQPNAFAVACFFGCIQRELAGCFVKGSRYGDGDVLLFERGAGCSASQIV